MRGLVSGRAQVTEGSGRLLVLAVGERSEWGRTMAMVASEPAPTPLQAALGTLAAAIGKVGLVVGALCFVVLLVRRAPAAPAFSPCGARDRPQADARAQRGALGLWLTVPAWWEAEPRCAAALQPLAQRGASA